MMLTTTSGEFMWMLSLLPTNTLRGADTDTSAGTPSSSKKTNPPTHLAVALNLLAVFNTCGGSRSKTKLLHEGESAELHDHTRHTHSTGQTAHTQHRSDRTHSTGQTAHTAQVRPLAAYLLTNVCSCAVANLCICEARDWLGVAGVLDKLVATCW